MLFTNPGAQLKVLIDERQLQQRVRDLGEQISLDYQGKHLHLICILKGACVFLADLIRHLPLDIRSRWSKTSTPSSKVVR